MPLGFIKRNSRRMIALEIQVWAKDRAAATPRTIEIMDAGRKAVDDFAPLVLLDPYSGGEGGGAAASGAPRRALQLGGPGL